jgi:diguanylate cyclase (GGDEF)-like protein/PAS domain S-box-containing protein
MDTSIARILKNTNILQGKMKKNRQFIPDCFLFPEEIIRNFSGPALLTNLKMEILAQNIQAESFVQSLADKRMALLSMIERCIITGNPESQKIALKDLSGTRHFDLLALPASPSNNDGDPRVLLIGKDITVDQNLTKALVDSRKMFKDLVECSSNFAWETDMTCCFKYVSSNGILGYSAYELNGKNARDLIVDSSGKNPFDTLDKIQNMEIWMQRADGSKACILVSSVPIIDNNSAWQGARGICHDITEKKEHEAILRKIKKREQILNRITSSFRDALETKEMLEATIQSTMDGIPAVHCAILQMNEQEGGRTIAELKHHAGIEIENEVLYNLCQKSVKIWQDPSQAKPIPAILETVKGLNILMGITHHHGKINGTLLLFRNEEQPPWSSDDLLLFNGIISQLGLAMEFMKSQEALIKLSHTDELTGLLNRRAYNNEVNKRIIHQRRSGKSSALFYIDLDNFKSVNDTKGHARGDTILQKFAQILNDNIRIGDYAARLGGDEFSIWLEEITEEDAEKKAKSILSAMSQLQKIVGNTGPKISISIGITMSHPKDKLKINEIYERADTALYTVKESGKNNYAFADYLIEGENDNA